MSDNLIKLLQLTLQAQINAKDYNNMYKTMENFIEKYVNSRFLIKERLKLLNQLSEIVESLEDNEQRNVG